MRTLVLFAALLALGCPAPPGAGAKAPPGVEGPGETTVRGRVEGSAGDRLVIRSGGEEYWAILAPGQGDPFDRVRAGQQATVVGTLEQKAGKVTVLTNCRLVAP